MTHLVEILKWYSTLWTSIFRKKKYLYFLGEIFCRTHGFRVTINENLNKVQNFRGFLAVKNLAPARNCRNSYNSYLGCLTSIQIISSFAYLLVSRSLICLGHEIYQIFFSFSFVNFFIFAFTFIFFPCP